jgi:hypothetical protein
MDHIAPRLETPPPGNLPRLPSPDAKMLKRGLLIVACGVGLAAASSALAAPVVKMVTVENNIQLEVLANPFSGERRDGGEFPGLSPPVCHRREGSRAPPSAPPIALRARCLFHKSLLAWY